MYVKAYNALSKRTVFQTSIAIIMQIAKLNSIVDVPY